MPKRGMFRRDVNYTQVDAELAGRAFSCLYAMHGFMMKKEAKVKAKKLRTKR